MFCYFKKQSLRILRLQNSNSCLNITNLQLNVLLMSIPRCLIVLESIYKMRSCHVWKDTCFY